MTAFLLDFRLCFCLRAIAQQETGMTDSEMRATVQATFMMLQRLIVEVAAAKGEEGLDWIDGFRDSLTSEMKKVEELQKRRADTERAATSRMLIEGVALMAKRQLEQQRSSPIRLAVKPNANG
jgi:hypothetical protein